MGAPRLVLQELDAALLAITEHPEIGHRLALHRYPTARSFVLQRSSYVVLYKVDPGAGEVTVVRARHGKREAAHAEASVAPRATTLLQCR